MARRMLGIGFVATWLGLAGIAGADETVYNVGHMPKYVNITFESQADLETIIGTTNTAGGTVAVDFAAKTGKVTLRIPVATLKTGIDMRDEHLRSPMWLEADKYPDITFASKSVKALEGNKVEVTGDLTIHGVTKEITTTVEWKELPEDAAKAAKFPDGKWMKFTTQFDVKLSDFGVKVPDVAVGKVSDVWSVKVFLFAGTAEIPPMK